MMYVFISLVLMYAGNRISAEMFQTSRTDSISNLTKVDGQTVFSSESLLFDVKSCNKVQLRINSETSMAVIEIYPNMTSHVQFCYDKVNGKCIAEMFAVTGDLCGGYTPMWLQMAPYELIIGEGCDVGESRLYSYPVMFFGITLDIKSIGVSSTDDAWWRLGESACQPVTTPATTTTLTTQPRKSGAQGSLANDATMNETMHKFMNIGRSGGTVCNNSLTVMTMVVTYVLCCRVPCRVRLMSFVKY